MHLDDIEARLSEASGVRWSLRGEGAIIVEHACGRSAVMTATRDADSVSDVDLRFIASVRSDLAHLLAVARGLAVLSPERRAEIENRLHGVTDGPWTAFGEDEGAVGGSSVIWVGDGDEPDLYLWFGRRPAPPADFRLVAHARQDIPLLVSRLSG